MFVFSPHVKLFLPKVLDLFQLKFLVASILNVVGPFELLTAFTYGLEMFIILKSSNEIFFFASYANAE